MFSNFRRRAGMLAICAIAAVPTVNAVTAAASGAWHIDVSVENCHGGQPINRGWATNPDESWNPNTAVFEITDGHGFNWLHEADGTPARTFAKGHRVYVDLDNDNVTHKLAIDGRWIDKVTGKQLDLGGNSIIVEQDKTCLPPPVPMNLDVKIVCTAEGGQYGTSVFTLSAKQSPATPVVTFNPADGTKLDSGNTVTVTATWDDPNHGPQSKTITPDSVAMCTMTKPPEEPPTTELIPPATVSKPQPKCTPEAEANSGIDPITGEQVCLAKTGNGNHLAQELGFGFGLLAIGGSLLAMSRRRKSVRA